MNGISVYAIFGGAAFGLAIAVAIWVVFAFVRFFYLDIRYGKSRSENVSFTALYWFMLVGAVIGALLPYVAANLVPLGL